jgi:predicted polyphosphate/ATP-dependent NAD kinase
MTERQVGLIVNPIAGMGGRVGLKGTDSVDVRERARELGAEQRSPDRARRALETVTDCSTAFELLTAPEPMGEAVARSCGFSPTVLGSIDGPETSAADTQRIAKRMCDAGIDVLIFAGGDGTARDVYTAVGEAVPVIGVPTGVKIYSGVFCATPESAGELLKQYLMGEADSEALREVTDIDEDAFRENELSASLYGYLRVPLERGLIQSPKSGSSSDRAAAKSSIAREIVDRMEDDTLYIVGPGSTTAAVLDELDIDPTLLGVDAVRNREVVGTDLRESELLELVDDETAEIIVGVIGGQGFIFGRGNDQLSGRVIDAAGTENVTVVASEPKLNEIDGPLWVDTGDARIDSTLAGYTRVVTGQGRRSVVKVTH